MLDSENRRSPYLVRYGAVRRNITTIYHAGPQNPEMAWVDARRLYYFELLAQADSNIFLSPDDASAAERRAAQLISITEAFTSGDVLNVKSYIAMDARQLRLLVAQTTDSRLAAKIRKDALEEAQAFTNLAASL